MRRSSSSSRSRRARAEGAPRRAPAHDARATFDVVVVGAGVAGLAAGVFLRERGLSVVILESRDRVGGRVWTLRPRRAPLPVELGAEFVHGDAPFITRFAREAGLALVDVPASFWGRRRGRVAELPEHGDSLSRSMARALRKIPKGEDVSFAEALRLARVAGPARSRALQFVAGFHAGDPERISARALAAGGEAEPARRIVGGYGELVDALCRRLPEGSIRLGVRVSRISWRPGRVEIEGVRARRAVLAVPLSILRSIAFDPPIPEKALAAAKLETGDVVRATMLFRDAFWEEEPRLERLGFLLGAKGPVRVFWTEHPAHAPMITGWAGGPAARAVRADEPLFLKRCLAGLAGALGVPTSRVAHRFVEAWRHDWRSDPHSAGGYSYPLVGGASAGRELASPIESTLHFAGEATCDPPANATVEGAFSSGVRAAREAASGRA